MVIDPVAFQTFKFKKPILIEQAEYGYGIVASNIKTVIQVQEGLSAHIMLFVWARAKLAEINPLIVTLPIAEDTSKEEIALYQLFDYLCEPIREAWTWKMLRKYAPGLHKIYLQKLEAVIALPQSERITDWMSWLNAYCILQEEGVLKMELVVDKRLQKYVDAVVKFSQMEPDASRYEELAYILGGPYGVQQIANIIATMPIVEDSPITNRRVC